MKHWAQSGLLLLWTLTPALGWSQTTTATAAKPAVTVPAVPPLPTVAPGPAVAPTVVPAKPAPQVIPAEASTPAAERSTRPVRRTKSSARKRAAARRQRRSTIPVAPVVKLVKPPAPPTAVPAPSALPGGWRLWDVGPPTEAEPPSEPLDTLVGRLDAALWPVVRVVGIVFILLRLLSLLVSRRARRGRSTFVLIRRGWIFVEGTAWLLTGVWAIAQLSARQSAPATLLAMLVFGLMVALSWNGLRDVTAGLMLAAERPFALGDYVRLHEGEGRVRAFRSRVLELETQDGVRVRVPYRRVLGTARVRKGGRQTTHAVPMELAVPDFMEPRDALKTARELASSSPWAVLGESPRIELLAGPHGPLVKVMAFAFAEDAQPLLHADLLSGWRQECAKKT